MQMNEFKEYLERLDFLAAYREPESWEINEARGGMDKLTRKKSSIMEKDAWCSGYRIAIEHARIIFGRAEDDELDVLGSLGDSPPRTGTSMDFGVRGVLVAPDTPEVRADLRNKGFDVTKGLASKQYQRIKKEKSGGS